MSDSKPSEICVIRRRAGGDQLHQPLGKLSPLLSRLCRLRGISTPSQASLELADLPRPDILPNLQTGIDLLHQALLEKWNILILGDFDADGATSCAVAIRALEAMGAHSVTFLIPNRFEHGYGFSLPVAELAMTHQPQLVITVDNGINAMEAARFLRQHGVRLLITDHHQPGNELPDADVIINPKVAGDHAPGVHLAGVGVIYLLMVGLRAHLDGINWFKERGLKRPNMGELLDLVALGTIADRVPLDHTNRILVHQGLARIRRGKASPSIRALVTEARRNPSHFSSSDLSYFLAPRLNAAGRLGEMAQGVSFLLAHCSEKAAERAQALTELNLARRTLESELYDEAIAQLASEGIEPDSTDLPPAILLFGESWHSGITGILSSRLNAIFHRPVWIFTREEEVWQGSGRSIKGLNLVDLLQSIEESNPSLLLTFGGHAMAAGVTIHDSDRERFASEFEKSVEEFSLLMTPQPEWVTDGPLSPDEMTLESAVELRTQMPWGESFPDPLFDDHFEVMSVDRLVDKHLKFRLRPLADRNNKVVEAIYFNAPLPNNPTVGSRWHLIYTLDINDYRGTLSPQLTIRFAQPL